MSKRRLLCLLNIHSYEKHVKHKEPTSSYVVISIECKYCGKPYTYLVKDRMQYEVERLQDKTKRMNEE